MVLRDTVNPFLAARAAMLLVKHGKFRDGPLVNEPIATAVETVAFPGLGTGVGQVDPNTCHGRCVPPSNPFSCQQRPSRKRGRTHKGSTKVSTPTDIAICKRTRRPRDVVRSAPDG